MADDEVTMKIFRKLLRYWIGIASVLSFLGGWVILAHSPKPVQLQSTSSVQPIALPSLPPIQAYGATTNNGPTFFSTTGPTNPPASNIQPIQPVQPSQGLPVLRTRGS
jgi:hypothetical protein